MIKKIAIGLAVTLFAILIAALFQSDSYRVERSITIAAPPAALFAQVNDLRKAQVWSPWVKLDPAAKYTFEGPAIGVGSSNSWAGNNDVGEGRQTIIESRPNELVRLKLEFYKPMEDVATAEFTFKPEGPRTVVTWSMFGPKNYAAKVMCLFMSMDKMIGDPFEKGLADLKILAEAPQAR